MTGWLAVQRHVEMKEHPANDKSWVWTAADFSDGENKTEMLCIRFGSSESEPLSLTTTCRMKTNISCGENMFGG